MTQSATFSPCPKCGSHDAKYLNVIYEAGITNTNQNTKLRSGTVNTTGVNQTASSQRAAPPSKRTFGVCIALLIIGFLISTSAYHIVGIVLLLLGAYFGYTSFIFNTRVWPAQHQIWQQSAMCQRCGTVYVPNEAGITLDAVSTKEVMAEHQRKLAGVAQPLLNRAQDLGGQVARGAAQKAEEIRVNAQRETPGTEQTATPRQKDEG